MMSSPEREKKVGQAFKQGSQRKGFAWEKSRLAIYRDNKTVIGKINNAQDVCSDLCN